MIIVLLVLTWTALWGSFDLRTILSGLLYGVLSTLIVRQLYQGNRPRSRWGPVRLARFIQLALVFLFELVRSTLEVTVEVLRPRIRISPAIVAIPLDAKSDVQITVLAHLVSLTPGTLSVEVSQDRGTLFVHALTIDDDGSGTRRTIKDRFERLVIQAL